MIIALAETLSEFVLTSIIRNSYGFVDGHSRRDTTSLIREEVGTHSTRAAVCCDARDNRIPIDDVLKTTGWLSDKCFRRFYDQVIVVDS